MNLATALAAVVAAASAPGGPAQSRSADRGHDEASLTRIKTETWPGFYRRQDADGLAGFLAPPFVNIAPDGTVTPRSEELAAVRANPWNPRNFQYVVDRIVWLTPDLALVVGRGASDRSGEDGRPCRHSYASSNLLVRAADAPLGWRALSSHVSGATCVPA